MKYEVRYEDYDFFYDDFNKTLLPTYSRKISHQWNEVMLLWVTNEETMIVSDYWSSGRWLTTVIDHDDWPRMAGH